MDLSPRLLEAIDDFKAASEKVRAGDYASSLPILDEILEVLDQEGLRIGHMPAWVLQTKGAALLQLGRTDEALPLLFRAETVLAEGGPDPDPAHLRAIILNTIGMCHRVEGDYRRAGVAYGDARREAGEDPSELLVTILSNLGALASHHGDTDTALDLYEKACEASSSLGSDTRMGVQALVNLAGAVRDKGRLQEAAAHLLRAHGICVRLGLEVEKAEVSVSLSDSFRQVDDFARAGVYIDEALEIAERIAPDSELHARCVYRLAMLARDDPATMDARLQRAFDAVDRGAPQSLHSLPIRQARAAALIGLQRFGEAIEAAEGAVGVAEGLREGADSAASRTQLASVTADAYDLLAYALICRAEFHDCTRLVEVLELRQARWLLDATTSPDREVSSPQDFEAVRTSIGHGDAVIYVFTSIWTCAAITLTRNRIEVWPMSSERDQLKADAAILAASISKGEAVESEILERVSSDLLDKLPERTSRLAIVPDGAVHFLPWAALRDPFSDAPLGLTRSVVLASSISSHMALRERHRTDTPDRWLLVGAPEHTDPARHLSGAIDEIAAISSLKGDATVLVLDEARKDAAVAQMPRHDHLHFACHATSSIEDGYDSGLVLAPEAIDGTDPVNQILSAREIATIPISASSVVLSGCSTGVGSTLPGEGLIGLAHAFQIAGASQVVASHWEVLDFAATEFMSRLYEHLHAGSSLEAAMLATRRESAENAGPEVWAAWVVHGPDPG